MSLQPLIFFFLALVAIGAGILNTVLKKIKLKLISVQMQYNQSIENSLACGANRTKFTENCGKETKQQDLKLRLVAVHLSEEKLTGETNRAYVTDVNEFAMTEASGTVINFNCWRQQ